jgi:hypothetical protein
MLLDLVGDALLETIQALAAQRGLRRVARAPSLSEGLRRALQSL